MAGRRNVSSAPLKGEPGVNMEHCEIRPCVNELVKIVRICDNIGPILSPLGRQGGEVLCGSFAKALQKRKRRGDLRMGVFWAKTVFQLSMRYIFVPICEGDAPQSRGEGSAALSMDCGEHAIPSLLSGMLFA